MATTSPDVRKRSACICIYLYMSSSVVIEQRRGFPWISASHELIFIITML